MTADPSVESTALPPHPTLTAYYAGAAVKRRFLRGIFDRTAADYDRIENMLSLGSGRWYRRQALERAGLGPGMKILDVAVGTGLVAREAIAITGDARRLVGLDPSAGMMRRAVAALGISTIQGVGEQLPLASDQFDFLSIGYALRHLGDVRQAFAEFHRVLKPGGRLCILEITSPPGRLKRLMLRAYMQGLVPLLTRVTTSRPDSQLLWRYYWDTIDACVPPPRVIAEIQSAGFMDVRHHLAMGLFSEYTATKRA